MASEKGYSYILASESLRDEMFRTFSFIKNFSSEKGKRNRGDESALVGLKNMWSHEARIGRGAGIVRSRNNFHF